MYSTFHTAFAVLALAGIVFAAPVSKNGSTLIARATIDCDCLSNDECFYGKQLTLDDYVAYLKQYYSAVDHYMLYSGGSVAQVRSFQSAGNNDYFFYDDFFDSDVSEHYLTQWPAMMDSKGRGTGGLCYRMDDADASSESISMVVDGEVLVFGAVQWQTKGSTSFFATKEVGNLQAKIKAGTLNKITHMIEDATSPSDVLATENGNRKITYAAGQKQGTPNASGDPDSGDCTTTEAPPTCDNPSGNSEIHD
nr:hypothetical protein CFP56_63563 [Quercus suber]